jgi:hypothetical protein
MFSAATSLALVASLTYLVNGSDSYRVGVTTPQTKINYSGTQTLTTRPDGPARRFVAEATYTRFDEVGKATVRARFVQEMLRDGTFEDRVDDDPDFLTILNQPFAVQLDQTTMHDLRLLKGSVPFEATSPLGGARLHGYLRPTRAGDVHGKPATGVRFSATGPMTGALPDHPEALLDGVIHMDGTAYYAVDGALLVALDATLTIEGKLRDKDSALPVRIVYHRTIKAGI